MRNYCTFMQKELMENLRAKNILVLSCVFAFFAITSPLLTRYMAEFIGFFAGGDEMAEGLLAVLPEPTFGESYASFYSNMAQIGSIAVILVYMSSILREKRISTADVLFTKGLKPWQFVLAKFTVAGSITIVAALTSVLVTYVYTLLLFGEAGHIGHILLSGIAFALFLVMLLAITLLFSSFAKSTAQSAVFSLLAYFLIALSTMFFRIGQYSPGSLMSSPVIIGQGYVPDGLIGQIIIAIVIILCSVLGAVGLTATRR